MTHKEYEFIPNSTCYGLNMTAPGVRLVTHDVRAMKSGVRAVVREHHTNIIPRIHGIIYTVTPDRHGNSYFVEVEYDKDGHRATYGGHFTSLRIAWQCYMD